MFSDAVFLAVLALYPARIAAWSAHHAATVFREGRKLRRWVVMAPAPPLLEHLIALQVVAL